MIAKNADLFSRARMFRTSGALTLALALSGTVHAAQSLHITLSQPADPTDQDVGKIVVTMINTGNEPIALLKYETPFLEAAGYLPGDIFEVHDEFGNAVPYKGAKTTFTKITADSYIHLLPNQALQRTIDLSKDYPLSDGPYSVRYVQNLSQDRDASTSALADPGHAGRSQSNDVQIWVNDSLLAARQLLPTGGASRSNTVLLAGGTLSIVSVPPVAQATTTYDQPGTYMANIPEEEFDVTVIGGGGGGGGGGGALNFLVLSTAGGGGGGGGGGASMKCAGSFPDANNSLEVQVGAGGTAGTGGAGEVLNGAPGTAGVAGGESFVREGPFSATVMSNGGAGGRGGTGGALLTNGAGGAGGGGGTGSRTGPGTFTCNPTTTTGNTGQGGSGRNSGTGGTAGQAAIPASCGAAGAGNNGGAGGSPTAGGAHGSNGSNGNNGCVVIEY